MTEKARDNATWNVSQIKDEQGVGQAKGTVEVCFEKLLHEEIPKFEGEALNVGFNTRNQQEWGKKNLRYLEWKTKTTTGMDSSGCDDVFGEIQIGIVWDFIKGSTTSRRWCQYRGEIMWLHISTAQSHNFQIMW